jgi:hypothetical protein
LIKIKIECLKNGICFQKLFGGLSNSGLNKFPRADYMLLANISNWSPPYMPRIFPPSHTSQLNPLDREINLKNKVTGI